ncbi:hypothetical protein FHS52_001087 [Erythromicrobium ramosum]|uniref:Methyltransferase n=1 Tax=Erythrobacter ramosus TaxID=35811 RepID=A0A6I4UFK5_9SPHN|nr:hypothetical protein [Erythrobacter ramosus]MBB3775144.1 hypothetical protein [Erythrobacter ramosus]MXP37228.1 hypothetical protein [Erythrobacter ramosus]
MRGEISSGRHSKRHPLDWYVDEFWCADQLALALDNFFIEEAEGLAVWDPCCGMGNTLLAAHDRGFVTYGSDLVENVAYANFGSGAPMLFEPRNFLEMCAAPAPCSIICNPPYSYVKGIAEAFARHALTLSSRRVCILMPSKWLASQARYQLFNDHPPQAVLHLCQRPSMPPGDLIAAMGKRAFSGGMTDYCWIVWDVKRPTAPGHTRTIWLPPLHRNSEILSLEEVL